MVTELRVHGVSGTPVESTLDRPLLHRVAGDADAGFHRPRPAYGDTTGPGGAALEGYRWGNLTAGAAARAMWLLLLPFMLANVTMWLRPPAGHRGTLLTRALCRVFGLSVTATFVLALAGVSLDLVAWQCATPGNPCATGRSYLRFLTEMPTGRRLAVLAVVPIAVLAFLWFLARRTWARYEAYPLPETADGDGLAAAGFWAGMAQVGRLRSIHLAAACGTLAALLGWAVAGHDRDWPGYLLAIAATGLLAACALALCLTGMVSRDRPAGWADRAATGLRTAGFLLVGLVLVNAAWARGPWYATGGLPGYGLSVTTLFAGQSVLLLALGVVVFVQSRQTTPRPPLYGLAGPVLGSVAVGVSVAFTAGVSYRVADFLDRGAVPTPSGYGPARPLQPPAAYEWTAFGFVVLVVVAILVAVLARVRLLGRLRAAAAGTTDHDFPHGRTRDPARAAAIDTAIADAQLAD
ncbi:MAG TPA: hypothetical protein VFE14_03720, partial [Micromonosporaceae bacterium]|nr:hypothetical protein [Micromonosporaceae bacterium]